MSRRGWIITAGAAAAALLIGLLAWSLWPKGQQVGQATHEAAREQPRGVPAPTSPASADGPAQQAAETAKPDTDHDGLPDEWEMKYFGSIAKYGPADSPSGDGVPNSFKLRRGFDPRVEWIPPKPPEKRPRVSAFIPGPGTKLIFDSYEYQVKYWAKHPATQPDTQPDQQVAR